MIKVGDKSPQVKIMQHRLSVLGYDVMADGDFGPKTLQAVIQLQKDTGLVVDGIVGEKTMQALLQRDVSHLLKQDDLIVAATTLGVDLASIMAIKEVESRGNGFLPDGRVVILYERHVMLKRLRRNGFSKPQLDEIQSKFAQIVNKAPGGYKGGPIEHYRLSLAADIHRDSANESCSWGLFQIMGYHWQRLGYPSIEDFVRVMRINEGNQLAAFCAFIHTDANLHQALKEKDWATFAKIYNGPGYKKNKYDTKLAAAYDRYNEVPPWP